MKIIKINLYHCFFLKLQCKFQCKKTGFQVSIDNNQKNKSNSCEKKGSVVFTKASSDMPSNFFIESILKSKRDISTYKNFIFKSTTDAEKY